MDERYKILRQDFFNITEPFIDSNALNQLKYNYAYDIDSKRKLSKVKNLQMFVRLLEKRNIISADNIEQFWFISKTFVRKQNLENKLQNYENWLKTTPFSPIINMYQRNDKETHHCCEQETEENKLNDKEKSLQQTVLLNISERLGRSWRDVARHLGIRECEIDAIQSKYPYDLKEQSYAILNMFMLQTNSEQWEMNLMHALEKGRRRDLKELLEKLIINEKKCMI